MRIPPLSYLSSLAMLVVATTASPLLADVKLPPVLSSHMVLQREMPVPIWGTAEPGEKVTVKFRDQEQTATADQAGKWAVKLSKLEAGGPDTLTVSGKNSVALEDVLVGEVWVGSGQSNMAGGVAGYAKNDEGLAKLLAAAPYSKIRLAKANRDWMEATPENVPGFSALLFSFGANLQKELDVPVGLMLGAVGGTPSGYWLSEQAYAADEASKSVVAKAAESYSPEKEQARYEQALAKWKEADAAAKAKGEKLRGRAPQPPVKPGQSNGKIGNLYEAHIRPFQPFAIRGVLWDQGEAGTAINGVDQFTLMGALIQGWRNEWNQGEFPFIYVQKPSGGGAAFGSSDPLTVKADPFQPLPAQVPDNGQYRDLHIQIKEHPATAMVTASDLGSGIHPTNKSAYGTRASRVALGMVYGRDVEIYGPTFASAKLEGNKVRLTFKHVGQGLAMGQGDKLQGFALAGDDNVFHWADAKIDGDSVVLTSDKVAKPIAVRYAWSQTHAWANLFNKDGLPALPFDVRITK